jgi:hypothetical protein
VKPEIDGDGYFGLAGFRFHLEDFPMKKTTDVQCQKGTATQQAAVQADNRNDRDGITIVRPTKIPMGIRQPSSDSAQDESDIQGSSDSRVSDAPLGRPVKGEVAAQEPPTDLDEEEVADAAQGEAGEDLATSFAQQYKRVCRIDDAVARFEIKRRRTPEYWELGRIAEQLKKEVGHGKWLPLLREHGYVERTIQRALRVHALFRDCMEDCLELTLEQAEQFGKKPETEPKGQDGGTDQVDAEEAPEVNGDNQEAPEVGPPLAPPPIEQPDADHTAETADDKAEANGEEEDHDKDDANEVKSELLWGILAEAIDPGFTITDIERETFATFMAGIGDDDRAVRVLLHSIWNII